MQRILVIDDDPAITSVLKRGLSYEGFAVDIAGNGAQGLGIARERVPDLVILDIMMPEMDGLEVLRRLRSADAQLPVLMLTAKDAPTDQIQGLEGGADDYVIKPFTFGVLLARVHALLRRQEADRPPVLRFADLSLDTSTRQARRGDREFDLTKTEYELLYLFLEQPRRVLTREILMDRVWGYDFEGNTNVLEVYVKQLRQKLASEGEPRLIQTIRGVGYALREEE
jgi:DNA-binding response OmpR family regulator